MCYTFYFLFYIEYIFYRDFQIKDFILNYKNKKNIKNFLQKTKISLKDNCLFCLIKGE
jgi:hypothetical protein